MSFELLHMKIIIGFSELQSFVYAKTGRIVELSYIDGQTLRVETTASVKLPIVGNISKTIGVNLFLEKITGDELFLRYDGNPGIDLIITGVLTYLRSSSYQAAFETIPGNGIVVHLNQIQEARKALEMVNIKGIEIQQNSVLLDISKK